MSYLLTTLTMMLTVLIIMLSVLIIEDAYGESPPPPGIHHLVARPADIKQDFAGFCRSLLKFGTFQQDLNIIHLPLRACRRPGHFLRSLCLLRTKY